MHDAVHDKFVKVRFIAIVHKGFVHAVLELELPLFHPGPVHQEFHETACRCLSECRIHYFNAAGCRHFPDPSLFASKWSTFGVTDAWPPSCFFPAMSLNYSRFESATVYSSFPFLFIHSRRPYLHLDHRTAPTVSDPVLVASWEHSPPKHSLVTTVSFGMGHVSDRKTNPIFRQIVNFWHEPIQITLNCSGWVVFFSFWIDVSDAGE